MPAGLRLDAFSARLLAIHQQTKRSTAASEHTSPVVAAAVAEYVAEADPVAPLTLPSPGLDTGCAECGGKGASSLPVDELRQEIVAMKTRIATLEAKVAQLDADLGPSYRDVYRDE